MKIRTVCKSITKLFLAMALLPGTGRAQTAVTVSVAPASVVPTHVLRFRLDLHEMLPKTVTVNAGKYAIDLINGVVQAPITVQLSANGAAGTSAAAAVLTQTSGKASDSRVRTLYSLTPGTYTIGVRSRPEWTATITVVKP